MGRGPMSETVQYRVEDRVAVLTVGNPPVNALSHAVRLGLVEAIARAARDDVDAVVLMAAGRTFPAGADIAEFGKPPADPWLPEVLERIEACEKPVVAAIHGTALGGGFELALACHYRLAAEDARLGLPEVTLGLVPGAGGTQRLPRLAGAEVALDLMISGSSLTADEAAEAGLVDGVVEGDLESAAISFAQSLKDEGLGPRPSSAVTTGFADPGAYMDCVKEERRALANSPLEAPKRIVDCVEAALLMPFETGMAYERAAFDDLVASPQSAALRHLFFAERRAARFPGLEGATARPLRTVAVVGGGIMGTGIAVALLNGDFDVTLLERDESALETAVARIVDTMDGAVRRGRIAPEVRDRRLDRLSGALDYRELSGADLVIEAVYEDLTAKQAVFSALDQVLRPDAIIATNTSYLDVDLLAAGTGRAPQVLGLHFFSPANVMRLLEVVVGAETAPDTVATALALAKRMGKVPVRAEVSDGFVANRMLVAYRKATDEMLEDGASVSEIDNAMRSFGFPLGPYQVADLAGLDISWARRKRLAPTRDPHERYVAIGDLLCESGRYGQKNGRGYYAYRKGSREAVEDPEVTRLIELERKRKGIAARRFAPAEIIRRALLAMVNEGARLLEEGVAQRPSDIDVAMVHGFAFPRWKGGPMKWADLSGLLAIRNELRDLAPEDPALWAPAGLLTELIKTGETFDSLNG
jgi:3-hydroxyacyl-CoA dehydrogenase